MKPRRTSRSWRTPILRVVVLVALVGLGAVPRAGGAAEPATDPAAEPLAARPFFFALSVADVEVSRAWYQRLLGLEVVRSVDLEDAGIRIRLLAGEGSFLELVESSASRGVDEIEPPVARRFHLRGVFKVGFEVDDLDRSVSRLGKLDVALRGDVVSEADGSMRSLQVEDPDGNVLQLFERRESAGDG